MDTEETIPVMRVQVETYGDAGYFPLFVSAEKASRMIGVSRPTVMRMLARGDLKGERRESKVWQVETSSIFDYLKLPNRVVVTNA